MKTKIELDLTTFSTLTTIVEEEEGTHTYTGSVSFVYEDPEEAEVAFKQNVLDRLNSAENRLQNMDHTSEEHSFQLNIIERLERLL